MMTLGDKLRQARKELGLNQIDVAELAGVHVNTIKRWENEHGDPQFFELCCVADVLGLSLDYLAGKEGR